MQWWRSSVPRGGSRDCRKCRHVRWLVRLAVLASVFAGTLPGCADVIVLKSGRRIYASSVVERDGKVFYETDAGTIGLPARLVERIERDGSSGAPVRGRARGSGRRPALSGSVAQEIQSLSNADIQRVVRDGNINHALIARLEGEARRTRSPEAQQRAAAASVQVALHYRKQREGRHEKQSLQRALSFASNHPVLLLRLAMVEMELQEFDLALARLQPVLGDQRWAADGYTLQGTIYYQQEKMDRAKESWKRALALRPDPQLERQLAALEREAEASSGFGTRTSGRFILRYNQEAGSKERLGRQILSALEGMYSDVAGDFHHYPREPIVVLLYPREAFYGLTGAPSTVHGIFDGKIRVPAEGLVSLPPRLQTTLRHELIHAIVHRKTRGRAPRWLQEGLAQWHGGQRSRVSRAAFRPLFEARDGSALARIQSGFRGDEQAIFAAYAASRLVVDVLERRYGAAGRERFLEQLGRGRSMEAALRAAFGIDLQRLDSLVYDALN